MTQDVIDRAKVLYSLTEDLKEVDKVEEIFSEGPLLQSVLTNPTVKKEQKFAVIDRIASEANLLPLVKNFLKVMCVQDEISELMDIITEYHRIWDEKHNIVRAQIIFGKEPSAEEQNKVVSEVKDRYSDKEVHEEISVDESLLGGYVVKVGYYETDMSYEGCFKQLERKLIRR
jgi:F-type H+-transporting ATPase subunit delta